MAPSGVPGVEQLARRKGDVVEVAPQRPRRVAIEGALGLHPQVVDAARVVAAVEGVAQLDGGVFALALTDYVERGALEHLGVVRRVRAAHERHEARRLALQVMQEPEVVPMHPRGGAHGDDVGLVAPHLGLHVAPARADEAAVVPGALQTAGDVERAEGLGALELLHDKHDPSTHETALLPVSVARRGSAQTFDPGRRLPRSAHIQRVLAQRSEPRRRGALAFT